MERSEMLELWNDMWKEGNWVPSWPDSLAGLSTDEAIWTPAAGSTCIWQEVVHVTFWRTVTLNQIAGQPQPSSEEVEEQQFAMPTDVSSESWSRAVSELKKTHDVIAAAIQDEGKDMTRIPYHLIHDAYHLGRITHLRVMQGTKPKF